LEACSDELEKRRSFPTKARGNGAKWITLTKCELYIDDIFAFASSEEELLKRLLRLFERFRKYKVTLNPDKYETCQGRRAFDKRRRNTLHAHKVGQRCQLCRAHNVKTVLGIRKLFSRSRQKLLKLLNDQVHEASESAARGRALVTFQHWKDLIDKSQMLFYFDVQPGDQVHLKTDASDYGIGAYLYIVRNSHPLPQLIAGTCTAKMEYT
jgi:hypothetical protein